MIDVDVGSWEIVKKEHVGSNVGEEDKLKGNEILEKKRKRRMKARTETSAN